MGTWEDVIRRVDPLETGSANRRSKASFSAHRLTPPESVKRSKEVITVQKGAMTTAHVRLERSPAGTKAHIHGGGLLIGRIVNELSIANKVAKAIKASGLSE
jgi:hypothetical protein